MKKKAMTKFKMFCSLIVGFLLIVTSMVAAQNQNTSDSECFKVRGFHLNLRI